MIPVNPLTTVILPILRSLGTLLDAGHTGHLQRQICILTEIEDAARQARLRLQAYRVVDITEGIDDDEL